MSQGNTIIVQKALGQDNIDALLKLSEDYKKSEPTTSRMLHLHSQKAHSAHGLTPPGEQEVAAARSSAGDIDERREEIFVPPAPAPAPPPPAPSVRVPPAPAPAPVPVAPPPGPVIVDAREPSPSRDTATTSSYDSYYSTPSYYHRYHHHGHHDGHHEASAPIPVGPLALAERSRSRSRSREIRHEIRALERERDRELAHRPRYEPVRGERELVKAERLPNGELVLYEEQIEREHIPKPARIEKDKKGRLSISLPSRHR